MVPAEQPTGWSLLVQQVHRGDTPQGIGGNSSWGQVRRDMYLCGVSGGLTPCTLTSTVVILSVECFVLGCPGLVFRLLCYHKEHLGMRLEHSEIAVLSSDCPFLEYM